jgi:hypothetical protein
MSLEKRLQVTLDVANKSIRQDVELQQTLKPYIGRHLLVNIVGDATYELILGSKGLSMEHIECRQPDKYEFYISMKDTLAERILDSKKISMSDLHQIKHKNVSARELRLARDLIKKHPLLKSMMGGSH